MAVNRGKMIGSIGALVGTIGACGTGICKAQAGAGMWAIIIPFVCGAVLFAVGVKMFRQTCGTE